MPRYLQHEQLFKRDIPSLAATFRARSLFPIPTD